MIKITKGKFKNRSLESLSKFVRPTASIKREAFFSVLDSYILRNEIKSYKNKIFLDLFAGIGTMGIEAISRGMRKAIFYENNFDVVKILKRNLKNFCEEFQYNIVVEDINISEIDEEFKNIAIVYIDPPYLKYDIGKILFYLQNKIDENCVIGLETSIKDAFVIPIKLKILKSKTYGKTKINFLSLS